MSNVFFAFNPEEAMKAGSQSGISTGYHVLQVVSAEWRTYNGNKSLNLSLVNGQDSKCFIDLRYEAADGKKWFGNVAHIQSMQGLLGGINLSSVQMSDAQGQPASFAQELHGRKIGFLIQKRLYTKGDGSESFSMSLVLACDPQTKQTYKEKTKGEQAVKIDAMLETLEDKDDRKPQQQSNGYPGNPHASGGNDHFMNDDIEF